MREDVFAAKKSAGPYKAVPSHRRPLTLAEVKPSKTFFEGYRPDLKYRGTRVGKDGREKVDYVVARPLQQYFSGEPQPIFTFQDDKIGFDSTDDFLEKTTMDIVQNDPAYRHWYEKGNFGFEIKTQGLPVLFNERLEEAVRSGDRVLTFVVANPTPHAMIYMLHEGVLYTVGFGFHGGRDNRSLVQYLRKPKLKNESQDFFDKRRAAGHMLEVKDGALYTADFLMPDLMQAGKIVWITLLTMDMINNMKRDLAQVRAVAVRGKVDVAVDDDENVLRDSQGAVIPAFLLSHEYTLVLNRNYCEGAGFIGFVKGEQTTNCLEWAQSIVGQRLSCGNLGSPYACSAVTEEEFDDFEEAYKHGSDQDVDKVILQIQQRLSGSIAQRARAIASQAASSFRASVTKRAPYLQSMLGFGGKRRAKKRKQKKTKRATRRRY